MRLFYLYLKQRWRLYALGLLFSVIFAASFLLYRLPLRAILYPFILCVLVAVLVSVMDFRRVKRKHGTLQRLRSVTDVSEAPLPAPETIEDADYREIIRLLCEEHTAFCTARDKEYADMVDYYNVWAHQIKTPIASMRLRLQSEDSALSRQLASDLYRIEQYVEMVLTFLRLNSESSDYVIKEYDIDGIVKQAIKKFSHEFIGRKLTLDYEPHHAMVITDEKWLSFVVEQVLSNALKYTQSGGITISLDADLKLSVRDTGIGIATEDLPRIFENGYTGFNGRTDKRASGIGLYLCRRICTALGHTISVASVVDEGTVVTIDLARQKIEFD